jgi:hypothetical protein
MFKLHNKLDCLKPRNYSKLNSISDNTILIDIVVCLGIQQHQHQHLARG